MKGVATLLWSHSCSQNYAGSQKFSACCCVTLKVPHLLLATLLARRPLLPCLLPLFSFQGAASGFEAGTKYSKQSLEYFGLFSEPGGDKRVRTADLLRAKQALSQLSYTPVLKVVGLSGLEPPTLRLSVVRSSQLSYRPILPIEGVPSKLNNVRQKRTDLRKSVGMVTNMSP